MKIWAQGYRRNQKFHVLTNMKLLDLPVSYEDDLPYEGLNQNPHNRAVSANWISTKPLGLAGDYAFTAEFTNEDLKMLASMLSSEDVFEVSREKLDKHQILRLFLAEFGDAELK